MITYERNKHKIEDIINIIKSEGVEIIDISTEDGNLEDVFIQLTKNQISYKVVKIINYGSNK